MSSAPLIAPLILGTRGSMLALAQAALVRDALRQALPTLEVEIRTYTTSGDQRLTESLLKRSAAGVKGLFTKELEEALLRGEIHVAVHSCKDMPWAMAPGLLLAGVLPRANTDDLLITKAPGGLSALPAGARVATSSVRRARQLLWKRPDLVVEEIRGNVQTRLHKLRRADDLAATILARAGLDRLGLHPESGVIETAESGAFPCERLDFYPAIGQGAIALQIREDQPPAFQAVRAVNHEPTWREIRAERELMRLLEGDCHTPVGVRTRYRPAVEHIGDLLEMEAILFGAENEPPRLAECHGAAEAPEAVAAGVRERLGRP